MLGKATDKGLDFNKEKSQNKKGAVGYDLQYPIHLKELSDENK